MQDHGILPAAAAQLPKGNIIMLTLSKLALYKVGIRGWGKVGMLVHERQKHSFLA